MNSKMDRVKFTNRERLGKLVEESSFDAVLATSLENVTYASGFYESQMRIMPNRMHIVVWPVDGEPVFIVPEYHLGAGTFIEDKRGYDFYVRDELLKDPRGRVLVHRWPMSLLAEVLREKGLTAGRIGLEKSTFPTEAYEELRELMPSAEFVDCKSLFDEVRMVKTPAEIELLQSAAIATEKAIRIGFDLARPGDTTKSIANSIGYAMTKLGADEVAFLELDVRSGGKKFDYVHQPVELKPGDLVRVDVGGYFAGYWSDIARIAVVGEPTPEQRSNYRGLLGVQDRIIGNMKPGITGRELFQQTIKVFEETGLEPPWGMIIHGIGLYIHERPWVRELETYELQPNMTFMVEVYSPGMPHGQIEDLVLVTEDGARVLSPRSPADEPYIIE